MSNAKLWNCTKEEYEADKSRERSTRAKLLVKDQGPALYKLALDEAMEKEMFEPSGNVLQPKIDHFVEGQLLHELVLEDEINWFQCDERYGSKEWSLAVFKNDGKWAIKTPVHDRLMGQRDSIEADKEAWELLRVGGFKEQGIIWTDDETNIDCKARLDTIKDEGLIVDLKGAHDPRPEPFFRQSEKLMYSFSAAWYCRARDQAIGRMNAGFTHVIVGKDKPYWCYVREMGWEQLEVGEKQVRLALNVLKQCREADLWPDRLKFKAHRDFTPDEWWRKKHNRDLYWEETEDGPDDQTG